nr:retrovirus-related Pol polyprotein from transposon TNT 1-94 [Tanacetum cinerariifolium]
MDGNAIANLHLALANEVLSTIEQKKTEKDIWDHLARLYEARSLHNKKFLKRKLYALRMMESTSVTEHVNNLDTLFSQLTSLDCKIKPQEFAILEEENRRNNMEDMQTSSRQVEALVVTRRRSMESGFSWSHNHGNIASTSEDGNDLCCEASVADEVELKTLMEMWTGKPVNYSDIHIFGSLVYVMYNSQETTKLDPKSRKCLFLGYADGVKGYLLWDLTAHKVIVSRDVVFMKDKIQEIEECDSTTRETTSIQMEKDFQSNDSFEVAPQHEMNEINKSQAPATRTRNRERRRPCGTQIMLWRATLHIASMQEEIEALHKNKTWELVPLVRGPNKDHINKLKAQLAKEFEMKDLGQAKKILGTKMHRDRLSSKIKPNSEKERLEMSRVPYASAVGSLMFAMICTRPDIAHAVGVASRYMAIPDLIVKGYVDSNYAGDIDGSKSTTGYVFALWGGTVSWVSKLQLVVAMSTIEAEYAAAAQASKEAVWLKMLSEELGHEQEKITLFCDNQSALYLATNPSFHSKTKHIRVQCHSFIRK